MKNILLIVALLGAGIASGEYNGEFVKAMRNGADTAVEIDVLDERGRPVSNAVIHVCYNVGSKRLEASGETNSKGRFMFAGRTNGYGEISAKKDGYYDSAGTFSFIDMGHEHDVDDGKWLPHPMKHKLILKTIRHPSINYGDIRCQAPSVQ